MSLAEAIAGDAREATKRREELRVGTLRMLLAALHNREIEKHGRGDQTPLSDDEVREVVRREVKKRREAIELYTKGGRAELAEKESQELKILGSYLPPELSREELKNIISPLVAAARDAGVTEFGKVMGRVAAAVKGKADAKVVSELVRELLG